MTLDYKPNSRHKEKLLTTFPKTYNLFGQIWLSENNIYGEGRVFLVTVRFSFFECYTFPCISYLIKGFVLIAYYQVRIKALYFFHFL